MAAVVGAVAAVLALGSGPSPGPSGGTTAPGATSPPTTAPGTTSLPAGAPATAPQTTATEPPATSAPAATTAPGTSSPPGGGPRISSLSPASGAAGQTITVTGTNLFSRSGVLTAYFGKSPARTRCPTRRSCTVTVPDLGTAPSSVTVTIVSATGTSNGLPFGYR